MFYLYITGDKKSAYVMNEDTRLPVLEVYKFLQYEYNSGKANNTEVSYAKELLKWYNFCSSHSIEPLTVFDDDSDTLGIINAFMKNEVIKGNCHNTVNHALAVIYEYYTFLAASRTIETGPLQLFPSSFKKYNAGFLKGLVNTGSQKTVSQTMYMSNDPANPINYINWEQYKAMLNACRHQRDKLLIGLMFENGLRIGEALGIHISDINLEDKTIHLVYRKGNENNAYVKRHSERDIVLSDYLSNVLLSLLYQLSDINPEFLFVNMYKGDIGRPMRYTAAVTIVKYAGNKAGLKVHPHMLRHGFGMVRMNDTENPWQLTELSKAMGHASVESTRVYAVATDETVRRKSKEFLKQAYGHDNQEVSDAGYNKTYN